jgi:hypothetical protein
MNFSRLGMSMEDAAGLLCQTMYLYTCLSFYQPTFTCESCHTYDHKQLHCGKEHMKTNWQQQLGYLSRPYPCRVKAVTSFIEFEMGKGQLLPLKAITVLTINSWND